MGANLKIQSSLYEDSKGRVWKIYRDSLPKKKGIFVFWIAECLTESKAFRENSKKSVKQKIIESCQG